MVDIASAEDGGGGFSMLKGKSMPALRGRLVFDTSTSSFSPFTSSWPGFGAPEDHHHFVEPGTLVLSGSSSVPLHHKAVEYPRKRYQILLQSATGPIDVYLVSRFEEKFEGRMNGAELPPEMVDAATGTGSNAILLQPHTGTTAEMDTDGQPLCSGFASPQDAGGIFRIMPSDVNADADYWLLSDEGVGVTDMWRNDHPNFIWDEDVRLCS